MHAAKVLIVVIVVGLLVTTGLFVFVPSLRPGFVKPWFHKAAGYTKATSAEDCLDKFKKAIEKRDYEAAMLYAEPDYREWLDKGREDAEKLGKQIDDTKYAIKKRGINSEKVNYALFLLDPFPSGMKYTDVKVDGDKATATLTWVEEGKTFKEKDPLNWRFDHKIKNSLLPYCVGVVPTIKITLRNDPEAGWRLMIPVQVGSDRHLRDSVDYLRKNGGNYTSAIKEVGDSVKIDATTKEDLVSKLKTNLEKSN